MDDAKELCKRVIIINHGKLLYDGSLEGIISKHTQLKRINVVFAKEIPRNELAKNEAVTLFEGPKVELEVEREKAPQAASYLLTHYPVVDLTIEEPQIEEIIGTICSNQKV